MTRKLKKLIDDLATLVLAMLFIVAGFYLVWWALFELVDAINGTDGSINTHVSLTEAQRKF